MAPLATIFTICETPNEEKVIKQQLGKNANTPEAVGVEIIYKG